MQYFCGIDTGGTFTDCVVMDEHGRISIAKSPSTPKDFAEGFECLLLAGFKRQNQGVSFIKCQRPRRLARSGNLEVVDLLIEPQFLK